MNPLRVSLLQTDIAWEDKQENLRRLRTKLETLRGQTDVAVLPETFSTGFSMNPAALAEPTDGDTLTTLRRWAAEYRMALAGSYIACDTPATQVFHNRAFFLTPEGEAHFYDKRHLFRMGHETDCYTPGKERLVVHYQGWNICLLVCYDLRFPVWSRPRVEPQPPQRIRPGHLRGQLARLAQESMGHPAASACLGEHFLCLRR